MSVSSEADEARYALRWNAASEFEWTQGNIKAECSFDSNHKMLDAYHFEVATAPIAGIEGPHEPIDYWLKHWVQPLRDIISFATMQGQQVS
jgi:hypothetical protein